MSTDEQVADVPTKPLSQVKFKCFHDNLGVVRKDFPQGGIVMGLQMMKIWTFFEKEDLVEDMNPP